MDPSPGNMTPSCPVAIAHGIRNARNPITHQPYAAGPAGWMAAALVMNNTIATKIATMSKVVRTRGRIPPAIRSEISVAASFSIVVMSRPPAQQGTPLSRNVVDSSHCDESGRAVGWLGDRESCSAHSGQLGCLRGRALRALRGLRLAGVIEDDVDLGRQGRAPRRAE